MNDVSPRNNPSKRRAVPGPKSKAIFEHEAEAMAPGLQSIALYSQIVAELRDVFERSGVPLR